MFGAKLTLVQWGVSQPKVSMPVTEAIAVLRCVGQLGRRLPRMGETRFGISAPRGSGPAGASLPRGASARLSPAAPHAKSSKSGAAELDGRAASPNGVNTVAGPEPRAAKTTPAVTAVGAAVFDMRLAPETDPAGTAVATLDKYLCGIEKLHRPVIRFAER